MVEKSYDGGARREGFLGTRNLGIFSSSILHNTTAHKPQAEVYKKH